MKKRALVITTVFMLSCMIRPSWGEENLRQGIYELCSAADEGFVLDAKHCTHEEKDYSSIQLFRPLQVKQQEFYLEFVSGDSCRIISLESGQCLTETDLEGIEAQEIAADAAGLVVLQEPERSSETESSSETGSSTETASSPESGSSEGPDHQLWHPESQSDGTFMLRSDSGLYLMLTSLRAYNGAQTGLRRYSGSALQKWILRPAPVYAAGTADTDSVNPYAQDGELANTQVSVQLQESSKTLDAETLSGWAVSEDGHSYALDEEKLRTFVGSLAEKYNTKGSPRTFVTSYQKPITLYKGNFGWAMDEEKMFSVLKDAVQKPGFKTIPAQWAQKGKDYNGTNSDIGDSYVEIDLIAQKVWLYIDGEQILETDCVSGTAGTERETPGGVYSIFYMQAPAVLRGADYTSPVSYWMAFNGNIGLHDAPWRSQFGGEIYKTNGSHGCVNLPAEAAKTLYEHLSYGFPVVCYH